MAGSGKDGGVRKFRTKVKIRFSEADSAGVLFFARYFHKAHEVLEEFVRAAGIPWEDWFGAADYLIPLRRAEADYLAPLRPGSEAEADLVVEKIGRSRVDFLVRLHSGEGKPACRVRMTCVFVGTGNFKPLSIPPAIREKLQAYLEG